MGINIIRQGDTDQYNIMQYVCDTREDVQELTTSDGAGSTAFVIEDSSVWMLSTENVWKELE